MSDLAGVAELLDRIEARLDDGDYALLVTSEAVEPRPVDLHETEMLENLAERVALLQTRVRAAMDDVRAGLESSSSLRRAATAYESSGFRTTT